MTQLPRHRRAALAVELLEDRATPAGNLTSSLVNRTLLFTGTDDFEQFQLQAQATAGSFKLIGQNGTTINGMADATFNNVLSLTFNLRGGDDRLSLSATANPAFDLPGTLTFNGGDGDNALTLGDFFSPATNTILVRGSLLVAGGNGDDSVTIQAGGGMVVQGRAEFNFGFGDSDIFASKLTVNGTNGLAVTASAGDDDATFSQLQVLGKAMFNFGAGDGDLTLNTGFGAGGSNSVGGNLVMQVANGDGSFSVGGNLTVGGGVNLTLGDLGSVNFGGGDVAINGLLATAQNLGLSTSGNLTINRNADLTGTGSAVVNLSGTTAIGGNLTFRGGSGGFGNRFAVDVFSDGPLAVGGNATFIAGSSGFNEITIASGADTQSTIGGTLSFTGGTGDDDVTFDNLRVGKAVSVLLASGTNRVSFGQGIGPVDLLGRVTVTGLNGGNSVQFLNATLAQTVMITFGSGADAVSVADSTFADFQFNSGAGDDALRLEPAFFGFGNGTTFAKAVTVALGEGNDTLVIGDDNAGMPLVTFGKLATFGGGLGLNDFSSDPMNFTGPAKFTGFTAQMP